MDKKAAPKTTMKSQTHLTQAAKAKATPKTPEKSSKVKTVTTLKPKTPVLKTTAQTSKNTTVVAVSSSIHAKANPKGNAVASVPAQQINKPIELIYYSGSAMLTKEPLESNKNFNLNNRKAFKEFCEKFVSSNYSQTPPIEKFYDVSSETPETLMRFCYQFSIAKNDLKLYYGNLPVIRLQYENQAFLVDFFFGLFVSEGNKSIRNSKNLFNPLLSIELSYHEYPEFVTRLLNCIEKDSVKYLRCPAREVVNKFDSQYYSVTKYYDYDLFTKYLKSFQETKPLIKDRQSSNMLEGFIHIYCKPIEMAFLTFPALETLDLVYKFNFEKNEEFQNYMMKAILISIVAYATVHKSNLKMLNLEFEVNSLKTTFQIKTVLMSKNWLDEISAKLNISFNVCIRFLCYVDNKLKECYEIDNNASLRETLLLCKYSSSSCLKKLSKYEILKVLSFVSQGIILNRFKRLV